MDICLQYLVEAENEISNLIPVTENMVLLERADEIEAATKQNTSTLKRMFERIRDAFLAIAKAFRDFIVAAVKKTKELFTGKSEDDELEKNYKAAKKINPDIAKEKVEIIDVEKLSKKTEDAIEKFGKVASKKNATPEEIKKAQKELEDFILDEEYPTKEVHMEDAIKFATTDCEKETTSILKKMAVIEGTVKEMADTFGEAATNFAVAGINAAGSAVIDKANEKVSQASYAALHKKGSLKAYSKEVKLLHTKGGKLKVDLQRHFRNLGALIASGGKDEAAKAALKAGRLRRSITFSSEKKRENLAEARKLETMANAMRLGKKAVDPAYNGTDILMDKGKKKITGAMNSSTTGAAINKKLEDISSKVDKYF